MNLIYFLIRLFKQRSKGFNEKKTLKQIKRDGDHFEDGDLDIKFGASFKET